MSDEFGQYEEKAIIALAFEIPEFFEQAFKHLHIELFDDNQCKFVFAIIEKLYKTYKIIPTRNLVRDEALKLLTVDHDHEEIIDLIDNPVDPREIDVVKSHLLEWTRKQSFGLIYSDEAMEAYKAGDLDRISDIIAEAEKISDFGKTGFNFFEKYQEIFLEEKLEHLSTGFPKLNALLNNGGPCKKEMLCWMAPTGVGKSIALVNTGVANVQDGKNVLHFTLEMSEHLTATRYAGCFTRIDVKHRFSKEKEFRAKIDKIHNSTSGELIIHEFPPEEATTADFASIMDEHRAKRGFVPDVIIVDYLELLSSKKKYRDSDDYTQQKSVSIELKALGSKSDTLIVTATQANRGDQKATGQDLDVGRVAESYGKLMALDYLVSLQQTKDEYKMPLPILNLYIAKNRNGPKFTKIPCNIQYEASWMAEKA